MTSPLDLHGVNAPIDIHISSGIPLQGTVDNPVILLDISPDPVAIRMGGATPNPDILVLPMVGPQGIQGLPGAAGGYDFVQAAPAASWVVTHGLGLYPSVTVRVGGAEVLAEVVYNTINQVTINFARAQSGTAHLI